MPRSLFYTGVTMTLTAAVIALARGFELLSGVQLVPLFESTAPGSILVLLAVLTMAAFFLRIAVSILVGDLFAGIVASTAILVLVLTEAARVGVSGVLSADVVLPLSYVSALAVAVMLLAFRPWFDLRLGQVSWSFTTPAAFLLLALLMELVLGYRSNAFYSPFLLGLGASLALAGGYACGHRRLFFESVALRDALRPGRDISDGVALGG